MKVSQIAVCLLCDEVFDMEEHTECPHCLNATVWPLHRWIRSLYGSNANIERINHEESLDTVQKTIPLVVGEELFANGAYLSLHFVQDIERRLFNVEQQRRIDAGKTLSVAKAFGRPSSDADPLNYLDGIFREAGYSVVEGRYRKDASHAVNGKMAWFTALKGRIKRSIDQRLRRVPDPIVLPRKGEWKSSEGVD